MLITFKTFIHKEIIHFFMHFPYHKKIAKFMYF